MFIIYYDIDVRGGAANKRLGLLKRDSVVCASEIEMLKTLIVLKEQKYLNTEIFHLTLGEKYVI